MRRLRSASGHQEDACKARSAYLSLPEDRQLSPSLATRGRTGMGEPFESAFTRDRKLFFEDLCRAVLARLE